MKWKDQLSNHSRNLQLVRAETVLKSIWFKYIHKTEKLDSFAGPKNTIYSLSDLLTLSFLSYVPVL
jgi:hypothetical protein